MNLRDQMEEIYRDVPPAQIPWNLEQPPVVLSELVRTKKVEPCAWLVKEVSPVSSSKGTFRVKWWGTTKRSISGMTGKCFITYSRRREQRTLKMFTAYCGLELSTLRHKYHNVY
jgi:hypothetical protein